VLDPQQVERKNERLSQLLAQSRVDKIAQASSSRPHMLVAQGLPTLVAQGRMLAQSRIDKIAQTL
jgi:hypothetical protein